MKSWIHDFSQLSPKLALWPFERTINAFARLVIYYGIILSLLKKSVNYLIWGVCVALLGTVLMTRPKNVLPQSQQRQPPPPLDGHLHPAEVSFNCPGISSNNSMGNPIIGVDDITKNCPVNHDNPTTASQVHQAFHDNLPLSHWDIYGKNNSQRQFYTVPTNDQTGFANWLYNPDQVMRCEKTIKAC
jgi:hypothetical protein